MEIEPKKVLVFQLSTRFFVVTLEQVSEVLKVDRLQAIPSSPKHILGTIYNRHATAIVVDLGEKMSLKLPSSSKNIGLLIECKFGAMCILVDQIVGIFNVDELSIPDPRGVKTQDFPEEFYRGSYLLNGENVLAVDLMNSLNQSEVNFIKKYSNTEDKGVKAS